MKKNIFIIFFVIILSASLFLFIFANPRNEDNALITKNNAEKVNKNSSKSELEESITKVNNQKLLENEGIQYTDDELKGIAQAKLAFQKYSREEIVKYFYETKRKLGRVPKVKEFKFKHFGHDMVILHENEIKFIEEVYAELDLERSGIINEVKDFLKYNMNRGFMNLGFEPYWEVKEINPIVMNGIDVSGTQHDFFSKKSTNYLKDTSNKNIDYILDEVLLRGYDDKSNESNDFLLLIQKKEFKDLIALELYEYYFWNERHEFDLQLLKEIVDGQ